MANNRAGISDSGSGITKMAEDVKYIIRVANTDLDGRKHIVSAITKIKGVGAMFANAACNIAGINKSKKAGSLSETEVKHLNEILADPVNFDAPEWMLNRRKDYETGEDKHLITANLAFTIDNDLKRLKKTKSYKGMRHAWKLPVRGQKTKSNFRRNKGKVQGVKRKKGAKSGK